MIQEQELTSAQHQLWITAKEAIKDQSYNDGLFLMQCLLRSVPEFLEARRVARQVAKIIIQKKPPGFLKKATINVQGLFMRVKVSMLIKKQKLAEALVVLENFLEKSPHDLVANRLMAFVAQRSNPPLLSLAIFSLETALVASRENVRLYLELATVALLPDETGTSWNPEQAIMTYQQILSLDPNHLEARQGIKNASALLSMKNDSWGR